MCIIIHILRLAFRLSRRHRHLNCSIQKTFEMKTVEHSRLHHFKNDYKFTRMFSTQPLLEFPPCPPAVLVYS